MLHVPQKVNAEKLLPSSEGLDTIVVNITEFKAINYLPNEMLKLFSVETDLLSTLRNNSAITTHREIQRKYVQASRNEFWKSKQQHLLNLEVVGLVHKSEILTAHFVHNMTVNLTYCSRVHTMHRKIDEHFIFKRIKR